MNILTVPTSMGCPTRKTAGTAQVYTYVSLIAVQISSSPITLGKPKIHSNLLPKYQPIFRWRLLKKVTKRQDYTAQYMKKRALNISIREGFLRFGQETSNRIFSRPLGFETDHPTAQTNSKTEPARVQQIHKAKHHF